MEEPHAPGLNEGVIECARHLENHFKLQGVTDWQVGGVCSRETLLRVRKWYDESLDGDRRLPLDRDEMGKILLDKIFKIKGGHEKAWSDLSPQEQELYMDEMEEFAQWVILCDAAGRSVANEPP
jgi:hypothetical protein